MRILCEIEIPRRYRNYKAAEKYYSHFPNKLNIPSGIKVPPEKLQNLINIPPGINVPPGKWPSWQQRSFKMRILSGHCGVCLVVYVTCSLILYLDLKPCHTCIKNCMFNCWQTCNMQFEKYMQKLLVYNEYCIIILSSKHILLSY